MNIERQDVVQKLQDITQKINDEYISGDALTKMLFEQMLIGLQLTNI